MAKHLGKQTTKKNKHFIHLGEKWAHIYCHFLKYGSHPQEKQFPGFHLCIHPLLLFLEEREHEEL